MPQTMTSWDALYRTLRAAVPENRYYPGVRLTGFKQTGDKVTTWFEGGREEVCDLLIGAERPRLDGAAATPARRAVAVRWLRRLAGRGAGKRGHRVRRAVHVLSGPAHAHLVLPDPRPRRVAHAGGSGV